MTHNATTEKIAELYRAVVAESGTTGITRRDAVELVLEQVRPAVDRGDIVLNIDNLIRAEIVKADERDGNRADHVLADLANGADDLGVDCPALLDFVVTLGRGRRKAWRHVTRTDLDEMNELRFGNVRSAQTAYYKGFKPQYDAWLPVLMKHRTVGAAVAAGDLPMQDALLDVVA